ncbi:DUF2585 family protein [Patescibacteria group bacterium]
MEKKAKYALLIILIFAITAVVLFVMGRTPLCECGYVKLWHGEVISSENSQHITDPYSFTHILHGIALYALVWLVFRRKTLFQRLLIAVSIESVWEIMENTSFAIERYRTETISLDYYGDSIINSLSDMIMNIIGFLLAASLPLWGTVLIFILIEIFLAWWIRDGLILNMLMLIHPFDAIKTWQIGK